jgi:hypothetical protein
MESAVEVLREHYGDKRIEKPRAIGSTPLAVVILDQLGRLASPAVVVSSFGWGVVTALTGELEDLARWPNYESELANRIEKTLQLYTGGEGDDRKPVTRVALTRAFEDLVVTLGLPVDSSLHNSQFAPIPVLTTHRNRFFSIVFFWTTSDLPESCLRATKLRETCDVISGLSDQKKNAI